MFQMNQMFLMNHLSPKNLMYHSFLMYQKSEIILMNQQNQKNHLNLMYHLYLMFPMFDLILMNQLNLKNQMYR